MKILDHSCSLILFGSRNQYLTLAILLGLFCSGCFSVGTYETARTVPKGETQYSGKASLTLLPHFGATIKYGLSEASDVGVSLTSFPGIAIHTKYRVLGTNTSRFASSIGIEGQFYFGPLLFKEINPSWANDFLMRDPAGLLLLTQINSYQFSEKFGMFIAPKLGYLSVNSLVEDQLFYSVSAGIKHGKRFPVYISSEFTLMNGNNLYQRNFFWTLGIGWEFQKLSGCFLLKINLLNGCFHSKIRIQNCPHSHLKSFSDKAAAQI